MSERRKIVFATDSDGFGGAEQMILTTLSRLDRRDWQPLLAHYPGAGLAPLLEGARRIGADTRALPRRADALGRVRQFAELLRAERPAIVHAHLNWPLACRDELLAAILARAPAVIATEHLFKDIPWRRSRLVQQALCQGVDRYVAVSRDLARQLRERLGLPARKIRVIHNGIPLEPFGGPPDPALRAALTQLPQALHRAAGLSWDRAIEQFAAVDRLYVIGRGTGLAIACEAALKFKEVCGIQAEAFSGAEVRHGPMALVGAGYPVLILAPRGPAQSGLIELARDLRQRGAIVLLAAPGVSVADLPLLDSVTAEHEDLDPISLIQSFYPMVEALARARGRDPDRPPFLSKITRTQ